MGGEALSKYLDPGSKGGKVDFITLLFILTRIGHYLKEKLRLDGNFEPRGVLEQIVKLFQQIHGLDPEGKFGPKTSRKFEDLYLGGWPINGILQQAFAGEGVTAEEAENNLRMVILRTRGIDPAYKLELNGVWGEVAERETSILQAGYGLKETGEWDEPLLEVLSQDFGIDFRAITPELFTRETIVVGDPGKEGGSFA